MGTINDIHNLISKLINITKDRQFATEILKIQSLVSTLQAEYATTHEKYNDCLSANIELKNKVSELEKANTQLQSLNSDETSNHSDEERDDTSWQKAGR